MPVYVTDYCSYSWFVVSLSVSADLRDLSVCVEITAGVQFVRDARISAFHAQFQVTVHVCGVRRATIISCLLMNIAFD